MKTLVNVARYHLVDRITYVALPWGILVLSFLINLAIAAMAPQRPGGIYTGGLVSIYVFLLWGATRWLIATLTSIAVIALIYHHAVPRTQPWHSVMPGAMLATILWFATTVGFRAYLQHFGDFATIYGSLGVAMALLVWMYLISLVVLVGAIESKGKPWLSVVLLVIAIVNLVVMLRQHRLLPPRNPLR